MTRSRGPAVSFGLGCSTTRDPNAESRLLRASSEMTSCSFDRWGTDPYRFRHWSIGFAPFLAGLSQIPPGAAVFADLGFILIAISAERTVIIKIRGRSPHGPHFDSS